MNIHRFMCLIGRSTLNILLNSLINNMLEDLPSRCIIWKWEIELFIK